MCDPKHDSTCSPVTRSQQEPLKPKSSTTLWRTELTDVNNKNNTRQKVFSEVKGTLWASGPHVSRAQLLIWRHSKEHGSGSVGPSGVKLGSARPGGKTLTCALCFFTSGFMQLHGTVSLFLTASFLTNRLWFYCWDSGRIQNRGRKSPVCLAVWWAGPDETLSVFRKTICFQNRKIWWQRASWHETWFVIQMKSCRIISCMSSRRCSTGAKNYRSKLTLQQRVKLRSIMMISGLDNWTRPAISCMETAL